MVGPDQIFVCPISDHFLNQPGDKQNLDQEIGLAWQIECPHCGTFILGQSEYNHLAGYLNPPQIPNSPKPRQIARHKAVLAHALRRMAAGGQTPILKQDGIVLRILTEDRLPGLAEQRDNLLRWFGAETNYDAQYTISFDDLGAIVGAGSQGAFALLVYGMAADGLLQGDQIYGLSYRGLERLEQLYQAAPSGNNAFMALAFGNSQLDRLVSEHFKPAVHQTGFELYRLDDRPEAGLIDARLRNEIRNCRFLIADLSHGNAGSYWEAGYAEGLGKPVIYTCEESVFDGRSNIPKPHFDANHHLTIKWNSEQPQIAAMKLKETIRLTIPEARQNY